jgi:ketosteroid isomerase-like protein
VAEGPRALLAHYDDFFTEDFRWTPALMGRLEGGDFVGRDGFARYWDAFGASFTKFDSRDSTVIEVDADTVLVTLTICVEGSESGVPVEQEVGWVFHFEDGRVAAGESHLSWAEAEERARA